MEKEDKTLGFIPEYTYCYCCHKLGATHYDGEKFFCEICWNDELIDERSRKEETDDRCSLCKMQ